MVIELSLSKDYIPEWNGNKDLPVGEQIVVSYKAPSMALYQALMPKPALKMVTNLEGQITGGETEYVIDNAKLVEAMVTGIKNLDIKINGATTSFTTARALLKDAPSVLSGLVDEIGTFLQNILANKVVDAKN